MKKTILVLLLALCLAGCGFQARPQGEPPAFAEGERRSTTTPHPTQEPTTAQEPTVPLRPESYGRLLSGSLLRGSVMDFTEEGCSLSQGVTEKLDNGGSTYSEYVNPEAAAQAGLLKAVIYQPDCLFLYVYVNATTGSIRYEDALRENVKKNSSLVIYGETEGDGTVRASRVYLERFEH